MTRLRAHASTLLIVLVALLATVELAWGLLLPMRVPSDDDWRALSKEIRQSFRPGTDAVVVTPDWLSPVARQHLGDLFTIDSVAPADLDRYARVFTIALSGSTLTHSVREQSPVTVRYDFTEHLGDARVVAAPLSNANMEEPHRGITPRILEVDYRPHRGLLIPVAANKVIRLDYADVELGASLVGYTGLHDYYARKSADGPVDLHVLIDGAEQKHVHHEQRDGWRRFTIDTSAQAGTRHSVRFEISAPRADWRNLGLHVEARK